MTRQNAISLVLVFTLSAMAAAETIDLAGTWRIALDPDDRGRPQKWHNAPLPGSDTIRLPGSLQENGFGNPPGPDTLWTGSIRQSEWDQPRYAPYRTEDNFKMPFWLQPDRYYKGAAWYQRTLAIPASWHNRHCTLTLERPHWQSTVWIDETLVGSSNHLSTPHKYDLSDHLTAGKHRLTIRVDNRVVIDVGVNSHSVTDHTQSNWNGIVGDIKLESSPPAWIEDIQIYPNLENDTIDLDITLGNRSGKARTAALYFEITCQGRSVTSARHPAPIAAEGSRLQLALPVGVNPQTWDEFNPCLYTLTARLDAAPHADTRVTTFGMREITTEANHLVLNGRRVFMRGTLECCIFPHTGYPPTDVAAWKRIISLCKAHGLNHIRFHSWCPPEAAFFAADELGFYFQVECSAWANYGGGEGIGNGKPVDKWLYDEADAILKAYGNHPSFVLFAYGNEPGGPGRGGAYLRKWVPHFQQKDRRRLVTSGSGWPLIDPSDFHVSPAPRIQQWGDGLRSRINSQPPETTTDYRDYVNRYPNQPVIAHEIGQWCVYPNFDEMEKYTGVLKPKNFEIFRDFLEQKHMLDQARDFLMASGKLQTLCYKEDIESALRTPNFGGFQLLDLHDFPGQGTALVGVLDPFWDSKPYVSPAEYRRFCGPIVPLARLPRRIFTSGELLTVQVDLSQFGPRDIAEAVIEWSLQGESGSVLKQGTLKKSSLPTGNLHTIGHISQSLAGLPAPAKFKLVVALQATTITNDWDLWLYPEKVSTSAPADVTIVQSLDDDALARLQNGEKLMLILPASGVKTDVKLGFSSIFWNTAWTGGQPPHTLGILCDPDHPAFAAFPTDYHSNWQWSDPVRRAAAIPMDHLPSRLRPLVQVVPDWFNPKRLGLVFEARVAGGSLLVCGIDLHGPLADRPVSRQLKHSLLEYMHSDQFNPAITVPVDAIRALFREPTVLEKLGARVIKTDSHEPDYEGTNAIDDDPQTLWHTRWSGAAPAHPHKIHLDLQKPVTLCGLTLLPRQDGNRNGWIKDYAIYLSDSPADWGVALVTGRFPYSSARKTITFDTPATGRYLRLVARSGFNNDPYTSIAELNLLLP